MSVGLSVYIYISASSHSMHQTRGWVAAMLWQEFLTATACVPDVVRTRWPILVYHMQFDGQTSSAIKRQKVCRGRSEFILLRGGGCRFITFWAGKTRCHVGQRNSLQFQASFTWGNVVALEDYCMQTECHVGSLYYIHRDSIYIHIYICICIYIYIYKYVYIYI